MERGIIFFNWIHSTFWDSSKKNVAYEHQYGHKNFAVLDSELFLHLILRYCWQKIVSEEVRKDHNVVEFIYLASTGWDRWQVITCLVYQQIFEFHSQPMKNIHLSIISILS